MATASFERQFLTARSSAECWEIFTDVDRLATWVDIVGTVTTLVPLESYEATLEDRLGPFKLRADFAIAVTSLEPPHRIRFRATGQDRQVGSRLTVDAGMWLQPRDERTAVLFDGTYSVEGRVATLGASMIRHKADALLNEFVARAERELQ